MTTSPELNHHHEQIIMQPLHIQVQSSLQCIIGQDGSSSSSSSPESIHLAQETLLALENDHVDEYVSCLLSLLLLVNTATSSATLTVASSEASKLRLAAILTLKAAILRRWKDRGRGSGGGGGRSTDSTSDSMRQRYLSETVKQNVRMSLLKLVTARSVGHQHHHDEQQQQFIIELQHDRQLQHNASAVLAKIGRLDLPLKFHDLIPTLVTTIQEWQQQLQQLQQQQQQQQLQQKQQEQSIQLQQTIQYNTMHTLESTLSEISTQRLLVDKKYRYSIGMQYTASIVEFGFFPSLHCLTEDIIMLVVNNGQGQLQQQQKQEEEQRVLFMVQYAILASKVVDHLLSSSLSKLVGGEDDGASTSATAAVAAAGESNTNTRMVVDHTMELIHKFLSEWLPRIIDNSRGNNNNAAIQKMKELLQVQCDMIVSVQNLHPSTFIRYLEPYLTLFYMTLMSLVKRRQFNSSDSGIINSNSLPSSSSFDGLMITHLTFLGNIVNTNQYYEDESAITIVWGKFYNPQMILSLSHTLLVHLFNNGTHNDNKNGEEEEEDRYQQWWKDDPEAYFQWENQRSSDEDVASAAQNLFLALLESKGGGGGGSGGGKEVILPWLINMLGNVASQRLAVEIEGGDIT